MTTNKWLLDMRHPIFSHSFIGFDRLFDDLFNASTIVTKDRTKHYPPYNILKDKDTYTIEMALAGITEKDIEVILEDKVLTISYKKTDENNDEIIHCGLAHRSFQRSFNLSDDIEVKEARLSNGLLSIILERIIPEEKKPKKIKLSA
tara:strand:+ start:277 stop:717 length:441 start_codon:yes stop_codon:yes gene_type:complete